MKPAVPSLRTTELARIHAERQSAVITTLLLDAPDPLPHHCLNLLRHAPDSFDDLRYGVVAAALFALRLDNKPITPLTAQEHLARTQPKSDLSEIWNFLKLNPAPLSPGILEWEAEELWNAYSYRRKATLYHETSDALIAHPDQSHSIDHHARAALEELDRESQHKNGVLTLRQANAILDLTLGDHDCILGDRILATGQSLVIAGPASVGKSRIVYQLLATLISDQPFLSIETHRPDLRWLILQAENSNRRLQSDLRTIRDWLTPEQWHRFNEQVVIHTIETDTDSFLSLDSEDNQKHIADAILASRCDGVVFDSLYNFGAGDLNHDQDMAQTCLTLSRLAKHKNPHRPIIVLHHALTGKAGIAKATGFDRLSFARNSKVLLAWCRAQINVSPGSPDDNSTIVLSCGKCSNGREFPPIAATLNPSTMIYELAPNFDLAAWQDSASIHPSKEPLLTFQRVKELCSSPMSKKDLAHAIIDDVACSKQYAYRFISKAEKFHHILYSKPSATFLPILK